MFWFPMCNINKKNLIIITVTYAPARTTSCEQHHNPLRHIHTHTNTHHTHTHRHIPWSQTRARFSYLDVLQSHVHHVLNLIVSILDKHLRACVCVCVCVWCRVEGLTFKVRVSVVWCHLQFPQRTFLSFITIQALHCPPKCVKCGTVCA